MTRLLRLHSRLVHPLPNRGSRPAGRAHRNNHAPKALSRFKFLDDTICGHQRAAGVHLKSPDEDGDTGMLDHAFAVARPKRRHVQTSRSRFWKRPEKETLFKVGGPTPSKSHRAPDDGGAADSQPKAGNQPLLSIGDHPPYMTGDIFDSAALIVGCTRATILAEKSSFIDAPSLATQTGQ